MYRSMRTKLMQVLSKFSYRSDAYIVSFNFNKIRVSQMCFYCSNELMYVQVHFAYENNSVTCSSFTQFEYIIQTSL